MEVIFLGTDIVIYRTFEKSYDDNLILDDINLEVHQGEVIVLCFIRAAVEKYDASMYQRSGTNSGRRDQIKW